MQSHVKLKHPEVKELEPQYKQTKYKPTKEREDAKQQSAKRTRTDKITTQPIARTNKDHQVRGPWMNNLSNNSPRQSGVLTCSTCKEKYTADCIASGHKTTKDEPFSCKTCDKSFAKERDLKSHETFDHKRYFDCRICGQGFADLKEVKKHQDVAHPESVKTVVQPTKEVRPFEFESVEKESIQAVVKQTKEAGKLFEFESVKKKSEATKPEEVTYLLSNTSYECKECGKTYNCKSGLKLLK